jgi:hypothetical protein
MHRILDDLWARMAKEQAFSMSLSAMIGPNSVAPLACRMRLDFADNLDDLPNVGESLPLDG